MISAFTARALAAVFRWSFRSEICFRANSPRQYVSKALISTYEKCGFSLAQRSAAIAQPIPIRHSKWQCGRVLCVQWLASVSFNQSLYATALLHVRLEFWLIIGRWTTEFRGWTPGRVRLSAEPAFCAFSNTLCGMSQNYFNSLQKNTVYFDIQKYKVGTHYIEHKKYLIVKFGNFVFRFRV